MALTDLRGAAQGKTVPASFAQQLFWLLDRANKSDYSWNVPQGFAVSGRLDTEALAKAIQEIGRRHEPLRTSISRVDGAYLRTIDDSRAFEIDSIDLRHLTPSERALEAEKIESEVAKVRFDISKRLFRGLLLRLDEEEHHIVIAVNHIAWDGMSAAVFMRELSVLYDAFAAGKSSPLPELPVRYDDWAVWQREQTASEAVQRSIAFWRSKLEGAQPIELPTDRPRTNDLHVHGIETYYNASEAEVAALGDLARRCSVPRSAVVVAAVGLFLRRYTGATDIPIGMAGVQRRPEVEPLIGCFVNHVVVRLQLAHGTPLRALVSHTAGVLSEGQLRPVPSQLSLDCEGGVFESPLGRVLINLQRPNAGRGAPTFDGLNVTRIPIRVAMCPRELVFVVWDRDKEIRVAMVCAAHLFDEETLRRMRDDFAAILRAMPAHFDDPFPG